MKFAKGSRVKKGDRSDDKQEVVEEEKEDNVEKMM